MIAQGIYPSRVDVRFRFDTEEIYYINPISPFVVLDYGVEKHSNGWYRIHFTYTTDTHASLNISFSPRSTDGDIDSSDTSNSSYAYVWGAQVEEGSYVTSYIPTNGEVGGVTRTVEYVSNSYTGLTNTNGTIFIDFDTKGFDFSFSKIIALRDTVTGESLRLEGFENGGVKKIAFFGINGAASTPFNADTLPVNTRKKIALTFKDGNFKYASDGVITTGTYSGTARRYNQIGGANITGGVMHNGIIHQLMVFDEVLSDTELISLTT
jgi:hypothetical protein